MKKQILLLFFCAYFHGIQCIGYKNCGSYFKIEGLKIEGCAKEPCELVCGQNITLHVTFDSNIFDITADLRKTIFIYMKAPVPVKDIYPPTPCQTLACPIQRHYKANYTTSFLIEQISPVKRGYLHLDFKTADKNETLLCIETNVNLQTGGKC